MQIPRQEKRAFGGSPYAKGFAFVPLASCAQEMARRVTPVKAYFELNFEWNRGYLHLKTACCAALRCFFAFL